MAQEKKESVGAFWRKVSKKGTPYYTGTVFGRKVVMFENDKGDNEKRPDFRIYEQESNEGNGGSQNQPREDAPRGGKSQKSFNDW